MSSLTLKAIKAQYEGLWGMHFRSENAQVYLKRSEHKANLRTLI